jgi:hypothetical protein
MISHKHKFIFVHIPKCGGTSIELALLKNEGIELTDDNIELLTNKQKQEYSIGYAFQDTMAQHRKISQYEVFNNKYFTFTFSRNPWARILSEYTYIKKNNGCRCNKSMMQYWPPELDFWSPELDFNDKFPTFNDFVKNDGIKCGWRGHNSLQIDYVLNSNKNKGIDFIGKLENIQEDFNSICDKIGIPKQTLPQINATNHRHYTEYYDDETRKIVAEKYAKDIEYFGYEFGE